MYEKGFIDIMNVLDYTGLSKLVTLIKQKFAPLASPVFTGTPEAPTATLGTNTNQIATTAFVNNELDDKIPQNVSELTNDTGYITGVDWNDVTNKPTNFVTTDTSQDITAPQTYVGQKTILFKQEKNSDKLGFTLYTVNDVEKGFLEFNPQNTLDGAPIMTLGNYARNTNELTHVGFRKYSDIKNKDGAYNLLTPLISDAKAPFNLVKSPFTNFYFPLGITDGVSMVLTDKRGVMDISRLMGDRFEEVAPVGSITLFVGATAPDGWLICDGSSISKEDYAPLFDIIGDNEGAGSTTFTIPDLSADAPTGTIYIIKY